MSDEILVERDGGIATVVFNRPRMRNAVSLAMWSEIADVTEGLAKDDAVRAIVYRGAGRDAFASGADISEFTENRKDTQTALAYNKKTEAAYTSIRLCPKPTVAMIFGFCMGGAMALAMACDIRIAAQSAFVSTGYLRVALSGDYGIAWLLTRLVGTSRARELMFTADKVDAKRCEAIGLVNRVVPDANLQEEAFAMAQAMAAGPTMALRYMKDNLDEALAFDFATARDHEAERLVRTTMTADHREAVQAFIEKRKAVFKGC